MNTSQKIIGKGKFSKVLEMVDPKGNKIAVKVIKPEDLNFTEIDMLSRIKSPYLVRSVFPIVKNTKYGEGLALELKEKNLLRFDISKLPGGQIKRMVMSLLYGLECIHKNKFLHLDIKPGNCLYENKDGLYTAYLSDFGFSMKCDDPYLGIIKNQRMGTLKYFPYEILTEKAPYTYNDKSDIWSLGVTILMFLGFEVNINFLPIEDTQIKVRKIKEFWDSIDIPKEIENVVSRLPVSELDKIDLYELLKSMLEKDPLSRISSKDFDKLRFYNNNTLENSCYLDKGKELLYIPYSSSNIIKGINAIRDYFKRIYITSKIEVYFLSIEIFIRVMNKAPLEISNQTLEVEIRNSFITAMRYYKQIKLTRNEYIALAKDGYKMIRYLDGKMAPNKIYYQAEFIDDLVLFDNIILSNYNLIAFYNFLDMDKLFDFFRQNYTYSQVKKEKVKTVEEFFGLEKPTKNTQRMIENERTIFGYKDAKPETKLEIRPEITSEISIYRNIEKDFRKQMISYIESIDGIEKYTDVFKKISESTDIFGIYQDLFKNKDIQIYDIFLNIIPELDYYIIKENGLGELRIFGDQNEKNVIFISEDQDTSLIAIDKNLSVATHYYSKYNENLEKFFEKSSIKYTNNYELGTSKICKIPELCIIFIIYYNNILKSNTYNMIFIEDKTLKVMLNFSVIKYDIIKNTEIK